VLADLKLAELFGPLMVFEVSKTANPLTKKLALLISGTVPTIGLCLVLQTADHTSSLPSRFCAGTVLHCTVT